MPERVSETEEKRRIEAFNSTKGPAHPHGSVTLAATKLGDITPNSLSRFLLNRNIKTERIPHKTRQECVEVLKDYIKRNKRIPSREEFNRRSSINVKWKTHWVTWHEFLKAAGLVNDRAKILILDIETAPNLAYVWGTWKQNINPEWIAANGHVLCWTAKWLGEDEVMFKRLHKGKPISLLEPIHRLLGQAHAVVHYNGKKFDVPTLNKEFLTHGMTPPAPYKQIDLLRTMWDTFLFPSNKLDYVVKTLGIGEKLRHKGAQLWLDCMADKTDAWKMMEEYNRHDVTLTEKLYMRLRPWIRGHPNIAAITDSAVCPTCGSEDFKRDGEHLAQILKYEKYQCAECETWFRGTKSISTRKVERFARAA